MSKGITTQATMSLRWTKIHAPEEVSPPGAITIDKGRMTGYKLQQLWVGTDGSKDWCDIEIGEN